MTKASRYALFFAAIGVAITLLIIYVQRNIIGTYEENAPYVSLGNQLGDRATRASRAFTELLAGSNSLRFDADVLGHYAACLATLQTAYDGGTIDDVTYNGRQEEDTRVLLKEALIAVEELKNIAVQRFEAHRSDAFSTGETDRNFVLAEKAFMTAVDRLVSHVTQGIDEDTARLNTITWITTAGVFLVFAVLSFVIYRLQHKTDQLVRTNEKQLADESSRVDTLTNFIEAVSAGDYNIELDDTVNAGDNLTTTLIKMRDKLKQNGEDDRKRNWTTSGLAQIGEILRGGGTSSQLYDNIIQFVVKYTKSSQGGLFILQEEESDRYLELASCYAFERKKYITRRLDVGNGLVGQCFLEGERIYLLEVPQEYINITSGLGGASPNALLMVPLKVNDQIYGVIELASFKAYAEYEIELVEKLAESIASTISNVRVNETTRVLLERTQQQAEEMKSQEEEIRQNMEELEATQEEMRRKQGILEKELEQSQQQGELLRRQEAKLTESQHTLQAIVDNIPRAIFWKDRELRFMGCNRIFAAVAGAASPEALIGKSDFDMAWKAQAEAYRKDDLEVMKNRNAKLDIEEVNVNSEGEESWVLTSKVPIVNNNDEVVAILGMFEDITARKRKEADVEKKLRERDEFLKELTALKQLIQSGKA